MFPSTFFKELVQLDFLNVVTSMRNTKKAEDQKRIDSSNKPPVQGLTTMPVSQL